MSEERDAVATKKPDYTIKVMDTAPTDVKQFGIAENMCIVTKCSTGRYIAIQLEDLQSTMEKLVNGQLII